MQSFMRSLSLLYYNGKWDESNFSLNMTTKVINGGQYVNGGHQVDGGHYVAGGLI